MNNTEKLLRAFIEASGYGIKEEYSIYTNVSGVLDYKTNTKPDESLLQGTFPCKVEVDYKVTKKSFISCVIDEWEDLTDYEKLMVLKEEIKQVQEVPCEKTT